MGVSFNTISGHHFFFFFFLFQQNPVESLALQLKKQSKHFKINGAPHYKEYSNMTLTFFPLRV